MKDGRTGLRLEERRRLERTEADGFGTLMYIEREQCLALLRADEYLGRVSEELVAGRARREELERELAAAKDHRRGRTCVRLRAELAACKAQRDEAVRLLRNVNEIANDVDAKQFLNWLTGDIYASGDETLIAARDLAAAAIRKAKTEEPTR